MKEVITMAAALFVVLGLLGFIIVVADIRNGHRQRMPVMEVVWPLTALWASWIGVILYFRIGRQEKGSSMDELMNMDMRRQGVNTATGNAMKGMEMRAEAPAWRGTLLSALHCGAGCALADLVGEGLTVWVPVSIGGSLVAGQWVLDYALALLFGVGFQYAAMQQMGRSGVGETLRRALKADVLSLTAWQVGMYAWMGLVLFVFYRNGLPKEGWSFWFMMQLAMGAGLAVAYPVNRWLIGRGIKGEM